MRASVLFASLAGAAVLATSAPSVHADTLHATDDTYVKISAATLNAGNKTKLFLRDVGDERHVYAKFDLATLPAGISGTDIDSATLRVYLSKVSTAGSIDLHVISAPWDESTVTAGDALALAPSFATVPVTDGDALSYLTIDVTTQLRDWVDGLVTNNGIALLPSGIKVEIDSKENKATGHPMEIEVALVPSTGGGGVPAGAVMLFNLSACPSGWSELTGARGRALVGLPGAGSLAGTVGAALTNLEDRTHSHNVDPAAGSTAAAGSHSHSNDPPSVNSGAGGGHSHTVNPPNTTTTADTHNHQWADYDGVNRTWETWDSSTTTDGTTDGGRFVVVDWGDGMDSAGSGNYPLSVSSATSDNYYTNDDAHSHSVDIASTTSSTSSTHNHVVNIPAYAGSASGSHTHTMDVASTASDGAATSETMPYIQLLVCEKD